MSRSGEQKQCYSGIDPFHKGGYKKYNALLKAGEQHPIEKTGARLRSLMPWIKKKNLKGAQAAY